MNGPTADYVIVGAGSAGCVLANRLSADGRTRVLLVEAGGDDRPLRNLRQFASNMTIRIPVGYASTLKDRRVNWLFETQADASTGGRRYLWPRGKVLGGSSSLNGMLYVRGQRGDYDGWRAMGCEGWGWADVEPYFRRAEHRHGEAAETYGTDGPLDISDPTMAHPLSQAALKSCEAIGLEHRDIHGAEQEGVAWFPLTVRNGKRCSTAVAYLHPAMARPNLRVLTRAQATRVVIEGGQAVGVEFRHDGKCHVARALGEVILAGGAVNSPQLLQLSGIGPAALLRAHGIDLIADLPGVGANLQDHYIVSENYRLKKGVQSINELARGWRLLREAGRYLTRKRGLLTLSAAHVTAFCRSHADLASPDIQFHILPATVDADAFLREQKMLLEKLPGISIAPCQLRPQSRGTINIASADPLAPPAITPNYLSDPMDGKVIVEALRIGRRIAAAEPLAGQIDHEMAPGADVLSDDDLLAFAREAGTTLYHPVGTCAMGQGPGAVLDPQLRVRGVGRLRVVDAGVMPRISSGNTNAPTIMIAEKASDMILGKTPLAAKVEAVRPQPKKTRSAEWISA
ncbi:GMC family oxidoreductase [Stakelama tenebrarum]|uniref:Choline dehydrogenase n=1 Tax=Stakelama tenebrarum TaxID=2711215 RepID=A0A6G6Y921_9SPHN|nr:GMC family oxidoreductase N-terminal domain-containing protein [Sphingosinithalassobacter tenebrarum]QIG81066.1 choline dehydrogenase [Sphingosinithalassobacter tenebrarum]